MFHSTDESSRKKRLAGFYVAALMQSFLTRETHSQTGIEIDNNRTNVNVMNTCFEAVSTPGCSDFGCQNFICEKNAFCCERRWDEFCVEMATESYEQSCQVGWPDQTNDCFEIDPFRRPGCNNDNDDEDQNDDYDDYLCEKIVCSLQPDCCNDSYDEKCVEIALTHCNLPSPKNYCISESRLPGCIDENEDEACLESVCRRDESCCSFAYGSQCVELARKDSRSCAPKVLANTCYEESAYGGCSDRRCQNLVCDMMEDTPISSCCDNQERMGIWKEHCVKAAKALCKPLVEERVMDGSDCPSGMICNYDMMANCTQLVSQYRDMFHLGNILGGSYCGNEKPGRTDITNCPRGSYCPDPETILPCPAGYYCPFKTQEPTIICNRCKEGSLELEKDMYGWIVLIIIAMFAAAYIGWGLLSRHKKQVADDVAELEKRWQSKILNRKSYLNQKNQQKQRDLEKLRPKLEVINIRLSKMESTPSLKIEGDQIHFDATRLFDFLDVDESGDLTFDELNVILGLSEIELREFIRRMNEMAKLGSTKVSVTRSVFAKFFMQVLIDTCNLDITNKEAEAIFDELADGNRSINKIHPDKFYASSMSEFLTDRQIFKLIKAFKILKQEKKYLSASTGMIEDEDSSFVDAEENPHSSTPISRSSYFSRRSTRRTILKQRLSLRHATSVAMIQSSKAIQPGPKSMMIERQFFIENYPHLLMDIILEEDDENLDGDEVQDLRGVDLCFENLSLSVNVGRTAVHVVNKVTGRIREKTMTALMGGSGAGKTSLLNALCGRAHYGETTGTIYMNGHETDIEKHVGCIGFVPQDDIVYAELTVRENLMFAGKFRLPKGTTDWEIEELVDETIANLGLSRVANNPVGDVKRRGVSGGEKKRVNIGIELMAMPSILFLDEPTSGLDASSALLVMNSLKNMVVNEGVTVVSVIHQPRKFIYELFDSLILLGVGGKMVYHGPTEGAESYFGNLNYELPNGESVGDWLIDISSGRLEPDIKNSLDRNRTNSSAAKPADPSKHTKKFRPSVFTDDNCVGKKGVTMGRVVRAHTDAKTRIAWLCEEWLKYFNRIDDEVKSIYEPPQKYDLPAGAKKPSFWYQFMYQTKRAFLVSWRNRLFKIINFSLTVGSIIFMTALGGIAKVSVDKDPKLPFYTLVRPQETDLPSIFEALFAYARSRQEDYALKVGLILCVLIGLTATHTITSKRMEFFREAGSGYDLNAYFCAINVLLSIEHSIQALVATLFATWLRHPVASHLSYYVHFLLLAWLAVSWSLLFPMICPPDAVTIVTGVFFAFCGLIFSGVFPPFQLKNIYENGGAKELIAGWLSPTRFFFEAMTVGEYRCLPEQSGWTIESNRLRSSNTTLMRAIGFAGHDHNAVRRSCSGWYWSVVPVICVGLTVRYLALGAMHSCFRNQQAKKPLLHVMKRDYSVAASTFLYCIGLVILFSITTWLFVRNHPFQENLGPTMAMLLNQYGFFD